ncbi:hypothetical protein OPT61_g9737 [Boeremia exigua]|uniref:Uncharacterized protein n=1 Tax=Boeremia exigua TaxID=749465 RepID=A0ACC2HST9_9PLEO|nr:hypothetical protein OPT61_g9737 [Boeremia exigua]
MGYCSGAEEAMIPPDATAPSRTTPEGALAICRGLTADLALFGRICRAASSACHGRSIYDAQSIFPS